MKDYLINTFRYNQEANQKVLSVILSLPQKEEAIKLFCHMISAQNKWYNRVMHEMPDENFSWFGEIPEENRLAKEWEKSILKWIALLEKGEEKSLDEAVRFKRQSDGKTLYLSLKDLCLQLNYHAIHHRAQINTIISKQGAKPPLTDYIFSVLKEE